MKSIEEHIKSERKFGHIAGDIIKLDWIFSKPSEKIIVLASLIWGIYCLWKWFWGLWV